ncbi:MAG: hypothetical protein EBR88_09185, partial [Betaproteobacteria bacterium]|nr:hypothetical protein [Betaproteobacteria bacterium]
AGQVRQEIRAFEAKATRHHAARARHEGEVGRQLSEVDRGELRVHVDGARLWNASVAWLMPVREDVRFALDIGASQQASRNSSKHPAYALVGLIWAVTEQLDLDIGYKHGLNDQEADQQLGVGLTVRW